MLDRVAVNLTLDQDEDTSRNGKYPHYDGQSRKAQAEQCNQPVQDKPDCQQQEADISGDVHSDTPFIIIGWRAPDPATLVTRDGK